MGNIRHRANIKNVQRRVADGFRIQHAGLAGNGPGEIGWIRGVDKGGLNAQLAEVHIEQ